MKNIFIKRERINEFSDAVFSIAMTLLILEIDIPSVKELKTIGTINTLTKRIPSFIGFLVSFLVTALYWMEYISIMKYAILISNKLLWLNICLLLFIVLMPFSTAFFVQGFNMKGPFIFYTFNLASIGLFNYLIVKKITGSKKILNPIIIKWKKTKALNSCLFWFVSGIVAFKFLFIAKLMLLFVFVVQTVIDSYFKKKLPKEVSMGS